MTARPDIDNVRNNVTPKFVGDGATAIEAMDSIDALILEDKLVASLLVYVNSLEEKAGRVGKNSEGKGSSGSSS